MSFKCTILYGKGIYNDYHLYYNQETKDYHLEYKNVNSLKAFIRRVGKMLEDCPMSDRGLYSIDLLTGKAKKINKELKCEIMEEYNENRRKDKEGNSKDRRADKGQIIK